MVQTEKAVRSLFKDYTASELVDKFEPEEIEPGGLQDLWLEAYEIIQSIEDRLESHSTED